MALSPSPVTGNKPEPADFGIVNPRTLVEGASVERWESGIAVDSLACNATVRVVDICNTGISVSSQEPNDANQSFLPYAIQTEYTCSTFGFGAQEYRAKAMLALDLVRSEEVEREFWKGLLAKAVDAAAVEAGTYDSENPVPNRYLSDGTAEELNGGTAVSPKVGLALLEGALSGARGTIHSPREVASLLADDLEKKQSDQVLVTKLGSDFIAGVGYDGSGPNGEAQTGTQYWMFATGPVSVFLSDPTITPDTMPQAVNSRINSVTFVAEQFAAAVWDGCESYAVLVDLALA